MDSTLPSAEGLARSAQMRNHWPVQLVGCCGRQGVLGGQAGTDQCGHVGLAKDFGSGTRGCLNLAEGVTT
jgi:hypothetical protein